MKMNFREAITGLLILIVIGGLFTRCDQNSIRYEHGAVLPEDGANTYEVAAGYQIELIASEPLIADPVDMEIDEYGNMYVVEMSGYPLDNSHNGKIKLLKDKDGNGVMDEGILFADNSMFPNGILRWKKGVLVTDVREESTLGLKPGDVLLAIDGRPVEDALHVRRILQSYSTDEGLTLRIMRQGETMEVEGQRR